MMDAPEDHPSYWPEYVEPTPMMRAIQMPMLPLERWSNGILNAHRKRPTPARKEVGDGEG